MSDPIGLPFAIKCSHCGHEFGQPLVWLKSNLQFRCPKCDGGIIVDPASVDEAIGALNQTEKAILASLLKLTTTFKR